jgi:hypothetical protein
MIFTSYVATLQTLDKMELELLQHHQYPPKLSNEEQEAISKYDELRKHIIKDMAKCFGILCAQKNLPGVESK